MGQGMTSGHDETCLTHCFYCGTSLEGEDKPRTLPDGHTAHFVCGIVGLGPEMGR